MFSKIVTAALYAKAPKTTFLLRHPVKGMKAIVFARGIKSLVPKGTAMALGAAAMVPVAAVAYKIRRNKKPAA